MPKDEFGIPTTDEQDKSWLLAGLPGDPVVAPTQQGEGETGAPAEPAAPAASPAGQPAEPVEAPSETGTERLWAGKYKSPEQLEQGYKNLSNERRLAAERARMFEQQAAELAERNALLEDALRRALPYLQDMAKMRQAGGFAAQAPAGQPVEPYGLGYPGSEEPTAPAWTPDQFIPVIDQMIAQRVGQLRNELAAQAQVEEALLDAEDAIQTFFERHPEVEVYSETDQQIVDTLLALNDAWRPVGAAVDLTDVDQLERVYEASRDEALYRVLEMNPRFIQTEEGMQMARHLANLSRGATTQVPTPVPAAGQRPAPPVVERASGGSPGTETIDEFEEAVRELARSKRAAFAGSIFE